MVTIVDIASRAHVAKSTVSNVLTGKKYVSPEITNKVIEICKELDYQPNFYASVLSAKAKTNIIGLFLEQSATEKYKRFYSPLIESVLTTASNYNYNLIIYSGLNSNDTTVKLKEGKSPIDGAIILSPTINDSRIMEISKKYIPFILIGHPGFQADINYVDTDNVGLTKSIALAMIKQGFDNLCLINSSEDLIISKERNEGFIEAFREYPDYQYKIYHSKESTYDDAYVFSLEALNEGAKGFITASPSVASGVYKSCQELNKEIGKDVVVFSLGYDAIKELKPRLSYASQDYFQFGKLATKKLLEHINGKKTITKEMIKSSLHIHQSFKIEIPEY
ncbi:MAG: LacI family DNA-binding transcriptional regulator [Candidatus Izemoplasmatales bacterium]